MKILFLFFVSLILLFSCKQDPPIKPEIPVNPYRLTKVSVSDSSVEFNERIQYVYHENKLAESVYSLSDNNEWVDVMKFEVSYDVNQAEIVYKGIPDTLQSVIAKYYFSNNRLMRMTTYFNSDNNLVKNSEYSYGYANNQVNLFLSKIYIGEEEILVSKTNYFYNANTISEAKHYIFSDTRNWVYSNNKSYIKEENTYKIWSSPVVHDSVYPPEDKTILYFSSNRIVEMEHYYGPSNSAVWEFLDRTTYEYDEKGYLAYEKYTRADHYTIFITYEYEIGEGNLSMFNLPNLSLEAKSGIYKTKNMQPLFLSPPFIGLSRRTE